jgi:hypothetical protein
MKTFFDKLFAVYSAFPRNKAELELVAPQSGMWPNSAGRALGKRWVLYSAPSVIATWKDYATL